MPYFPRSSRPFQSSSCCEVAVLEEVPHHRDYDLSERECESNRITQICASRAGTRVLVLDVQRKHEAAQICASARHFTLRGVGHGHAVPSRSQHQGLRPVRRPLNRVVTTRSATG